jgi:hypothetical protein
LRERYVQAFIQRQLCHLTRLHYCCSIARDHVRVRPLPCVSLSRARAAPLAVQSSCRQCSDKSGLCLAAGGTRTKRTDTWIFCRIVTFFISHQVNGRCDWSAVVPGLGRWLTLDNHLEENELPVRSAVALTDRFSTYIAARSRTVLASVRMQQGITGGAPTSWCLTRHLRRSTVW